MFEYNMHIEHNYRCERQKVTNWNLYKVMQCSVISFLCTFWFLTPNRFIYVPNKKRTHVTIVTSLNIWTSSREFGTYRLCEQRRFRRACASAQSRQNLRCSLIQTMSQEEPSDRKPDPWPVWMAGHAQLKFVMTECSKTQIRLMGLIYKLLLLSNFNNWILMRIALHHSWSLKTYKLKIWFFLGFRFLE